MKKMLLTALLFCFVVAEDEFFEPGATIGGYGELHYTNASNPDCEGDDCFNSTKLDFHRWILFVNYNFTPEWSLKSELEIEHNMIGGGTSGSSSTMEYEIESYNTHPIDDDGDGAWDLDVDGNIIMETDTTMVTVTDTDTTDGDIKFGGEVELEQAYINYHNAGGWGFGAGVLLISAGIINETHEPPTFLSVERPAYNSEIIPTTWFGNGAMVYGSFGDIHAKFVLHEDMNGGDMLDGLAFGGLRSGRAKGYKSTAYHWTKNMSMHWTGMEGLNVGGSYTFGGAETGLNSVPGRDYVDWSLMEFHGQYNANNIIAAFEYGAVNFSHVEDNADDTLVPEQVASGYYMQLGYDLAPMMGWEDCKLAPWFGMGMYDLNDLVDGDVSNTMFGLTWWPTDQVSWKMDYDMQVTTDADGNEKKSNVMSLGVGYMF